LPPLPPFAAGATITTAVADGLVTSTVGGTAPVANPANAPASVTTTPDPTEPED
jgi:hypothetical protein